MPRHTVNYLNGQLTTFLGNNPNSKIIQKLLKKKRRLLVENPWGDDTISFLMTGNDVPQLIDSLNSLILPPRFSAIFHTDTKMMEFIWIAMEKDDEIIPRSFSFNFNGNNYKCYYSEASDKLKILAKHAIRRRWQSPSEHRNILGLHQYYQDILDDPDQAENMTPISFFVKGFNSYDENLLVELSKNLNFHMQYFDRYSPIVSIHYQTSPEDVSNESIQYISGSFPNIIVSKSKDPLLLDFASEAIESDVRMMYLYFYQIIERASYYYLGDSIKSKLLRLLNSPDIQTNTDNYIEKVTATVLEDAKTDDESKIEKTIKALCSTQNLWKEIYPNIKFFSKPTSFSGGFVTNSIISETSDYNGFCNCWHPTLINQIRHIRNALVHGREKTYGSIILPTRDNDKLLRPWATIIRRMAEDVILYSKIE